MKQRNLKNSPFNIVVVVAALGYFVDVYDLILFSIVRVPSLKSLGLQGEELTNISVNLLNIQMLGMLLGGILWGILGDKKGRLSILFLTILLYSVANIANGMVQTINQYYVLRFFAGLGLAGELGIGITLVSEVMPKETRGYGTTLVSGVGIAGAILGFWVADIFDWRMAYYVGGGLGLVLLVLRISLYESGMYSRLKETKIKKGHFLSLFQHKKMFSKYLKCILMGVPVWYVIAILVTFAPELGSENGLHVNGIILGGKAVMYFYIGGSLGSFIFGLVSEWLRSRKKAILIALSTLTISIILFFLAEGVSTTMFYFILFIVGLQTGYWAVFVTTASEQFGTNIRATVTTTVPNFVRGATILVTTVFGWLKSTSPGIIGSAIIVGVVVITLAFYATLKIEETYHKDLDYYDE